jgi:hypothetical protein
MKNKRCKICKEPFVARFSTLQTVCENPKCILKNAEVVALKRTKADINRRREAIKSVSQWRKEFQQVFNTYIRLRDSKLPCISCNKPLPAKYDAGHYYSVGSYPNLRFNEYNVHAQCVVCNQHKSGNLLEYTAGIEARIGIEKLNELKSMRHLPLRLPLDEIKTGITLYKSKIKQIKNESRINPTK